MKKLISLILTLGLLMTSVNMAVPGVSAATVDAENFELYTTIDMSAYYNVKQYLSEETAGTISEDEALGTYDFFKEPETNGKIIKPYAISKEAMDEFITDGIATFDGVPFKVSTPDNEKGAYKQGSAITVPTGYYKRIKLLTVSAPETIGNNYIYPSVKTVSGLEKSIGEITKGGILVGNVSLAKVYATDEITDSEGNIKTSKISVVTINVPEGYEELKSFKLWTLAGGNLRILGATLVGPVGDEWNSIIAEKIEALPEKDAITESNYTAVEEIADIIKLAKKDGADTSKIEGIEKYNEIKRYVEAKKELYTMVDISSKFNAKVFLSTETAGTLEADSVAAPDFFVAKKSDGTFTHPRALSKNGIDSLKVNGVITLGGIPYDVKTLDNQPSAFYTNPSGNITVPTGYYSKIKILYTYGVESTGDNTFYTSCKFVDDTSGSLVNGKGTYLKSVNWVKVYSDDTLPTSGANLMEQSYEPSDKTKELKSINIYSQAGNYKRVLAVTLVGLQGDEYAPLIASKIATLPEAEAITESDFAVISEVEKLVEKAKVTGADLTAIEGTEKYNAIIERRDEILALYTPVDISARFNAKSFLSPSDAGTVTEAAIPDYFMGTAVTADTAMALNRDKALEVTEGGVLKYNGIPYNMPLPKDGKDSYSYQQGGALALPEGNYEEIRLLVSTVDPYKSEQGKIYNGFNYSDGTKSSSAVIVPYKHDSTEKTGLVLSLGTVNATKAGVSETGGNIYEYVLKNPSPKKIIKTISLAKGGSYNSGTRILAVTLKKYKAPVLVEEATLTNGENITINITFKNAEDPALLTKENIKLINRAGELDYTITPVLEGDKAYGVVLTTKNSLENDKNYQLSMDFGNDKIYGNAFVALNPVTLSGYELINSDGETVSKVADIQDGKLYVKPMIENNVYTEAKTVKVIAAVYNGTKLEAVKTANPSVAMGTPYNEAIEVIIPTEGLTDAWNAKVYVWDEDMITPVTADKKLTYAADILADTTKDITVAFIGGSITEGRNITTPFVQKWQAERSGEITYINAGQGGTGSNYGAMRLYEEVLSKNPDVVFIDFAGNDIYSTDAQIKSNVEAMIKQIEAMEHQPVVIPWFWPHRNINSYVASHNSWREASEYYGLNVLDTHTLCATEIEKGNATWDDYTLATDVHPNKTQGEKIAELAFNEFIQNADKYIRSIKMMPKKYGSDDYTEPCHVSSSDLDYATYDENWSDTKVDDVVTEGYNVPTGLPFKSFMASATTGATMTFKFSGTKLIISSLMGKLGRSASYTITNSDGVVEKSGSISNYIADYNWYENVILSLTGLEDTEHTLTVTVKDGTGIFGIGDFWIDE